MSAQTGNAYLQTVLVSNVANGTASVDPNLVDPWGISFSATSPFWLSNHLSGTSTVYNGLGAVTTTVVTIPPGAASPPGTIGRPTGQVKPAATTPATFVIPQPNGRAASFIFSTEDGTISAWNAGTLATVTIDNSKQNAVYKGLAIGVSAAGQTLYAPNFRSGKIEIYDGNWAPITLSGSFTDPSVPAGYAPFNIWNLGNTLYVAYAKQDADKFLDVAGAGNGYVATFDQNGNLISHLISGGTLNSPWGVAVAPAVWGAFGGDVLVGNFGDGRINAFDVKTGAFHGTLQDTNGNPITLAGLWAIVFGNGGSGGDVKTLYYAAGVPNGSKIARGLLGSIAPPAAITSIVSSASRQAGPVSPGELVTIGGQTVGPGLGAAATIPPTAAGLATALGGTTVTVNGIAAPVLYTNGSQTNIQIPYEIAGNTAATVVLKTGAQTTAAFPLQVAPTAPGLFTLDFSGQGAAVALNADNTLNTAANAAARGTTVTLFATGEGVTNPASTNGQLETDTSRVPVAPVSVTIGGLPATVNADTSVPRDVAGVLEILVTVPAGATPGAAPVVLTIGGVATKQTATVFVK